MINNGRRDVYETISDDERKDKDEKDRNDANDDKKENIYKKKFMHVTVAPKVLGVNPRCLRFDLTPPSLFIRTILFLIDLLIIFFEKFLLSLSKLLSSEFSFISI